MTHQEDVDFVAEKARETFLQIRRIRKTRPNFTRAQKNALEAEIKQLKDQWWQDVKGRMTKEPVGANDD